MSNKTYGEIIDTLKSINELLEEASVEMEEAHKSIKNGLGREALEEFDEAFYKSQASVAMMRDMRECLRKWAA